MLDDLSRGEAPRPPGPFTAGSLRSILSDVLKQGHLPSWGDLEWLAKSLNLTCSAFTFARDVGKRSKGNAGRVAAALETLILFFEERRAECCPQLGNAAPSQEIINAERQLYDQFQGFMQALREHDFQLNMDAGLLMPDTENWRDIAWTVAEAFRVAMARNNSGSKLGLSNDGPLPRFVAAVIPLITGEAPSVGNVGKHLKDEARARKTGTNGN